MLDAAQEMDRHVVPNNTAATPNIICDKCKDLVDDLQDLLQKPSPKPPSFLVSTTIFGPYLISTIQKSGLEGCHICSIITQGLCPAHSESEVRRTSKSVVTMNLSRPSKLAVDNGIVAFVTARMEEPGGRVLIPHQTFYIEVTNKPKQIAPVSLSISTGSDATLELARSWLSHCLSQHTLCEELRKTAASQSTSVSPTYLVQVDPLNLRLCPTKELAETPTYLALSHRWGGSHIFRLLSHNLTSLLRTINLNDLPKTFQDAILITRQLGYHYLWIDSICIIQDSKEHWQYESAIMGDIYRGSACTIAALGGVDGDSGCFKTRNPLCFQRYTFDIKDQGRTMFMAPEKEKTSVRNTGYGPSVEPLHERAWVMQERMLSPRTLYFGSLGIYWECVVGDVSNNMSTELQTSVVSTKFAINDACNMKVTGEFDTSYKLFWRWWTAILLMYSPCGLTFGSDKLVAIAGIVKLLEWRTGLHNIAGLWKEFLLPELLWYVSSPQERPQGTYQAPTWSWASMNCEVATGIQDFDYNFEWKTKLIEAVATLAAPNGQLSSAYICVHGPLMRVRCAPQVDEDGDIDGYKLRWGIKDPEENSADDGVSFMPDIQLDLTTEIWALLIVHATSSTAWMNMGVVLAKTESKDAFIRVGSFRQYDWPTSSTNFFGDSLTEMATITIL